MRVRVAYTVTVDDDYRMALRHQMSQCGTLATRDEVRDQLWMSGESEDNDIMQEWQDCDECQTSSRIRHWREQPE